MTFIYLIPIALAVVSDCSEVFRLRCAFSDCTGSRFRLPSDFFRLLSTFFQLLGKPFPAAQYLFRMLSTFFDALAVVSDFSVPFLIARHSSCFRVQNKLFYMLIHLNLTTRLLVTSINSKFIQVLKANKGKSVSICVRPIWRDKLVALLGWWVYPQQKPGATASTKASAKCRAPALCSPLLQQMRVCRRTRERWRTLRGSASQTITET